VPKRPSVRRRRGRRRRDARRRGRCSNSPLLACRASGRPAETSNSGPRRSSAHEPVSSTGRGVALARPSVQGCPRCARRYAALHRPRCGSRATARTCQSSIAYLRLVRDTDCTPPPRPHHPVDRQPGRARRARPARRRVRRAQQAEDLAVARRGARPWRGDRSPSGRGHRSCCLGDTQTRPPVIT